MNIVWLGEPACNDPRLAGGKAAALSRLATAYRIPPGFCLTTAAFDHALASGLLPDPGVREQVSPGGSPLQASPSADELRAAYQRLAERVGRELPTTAVRSSGVDEDGSHVSFAGQHETSLNICGIDAITAAILRCWASTTTPRALEYRRHHGLPLDRPRPAVLVQSLVLADVSAVVFSANPRTGSAEEILITASWGLGESVVGGMVTPDTWFVRKRDLAITARLIGDKRSMTVPAGAEQPGCVGQGTREVDVPRLLRGRPALDDGQVAELAALATALEMTAGRPIDAECAYQDGSLYLLQCRPITTAPR